MRSLNKKAQIGNLQGIVMTLVIIGILLGVAFMVLEEFRDQMDSGTDAYTGVNKTIGALAKVPTWLGIIVILAIVGILIAIVFSVLPRATTQI
ncbi:MAG: hypothetical protein ACTSPV_01165 [Candidatus Hodarchaeales archaeon]